MRSNTRKIIALLLFFLFLEKAGLRLLIHSYCHESALETSVSKKENLPFKSLTQQSCDCLDDFFVPLTPSEEYIIITTPKSYIYKASISYKNLFRSTSIPCSQLRGPPAII